MYGVREDPSTFCEPKTGVTVDEDDDEESEFEPVDMVVTGESCDFESLKASVNRLFTMSTLIRTKYTSCLLQEH